MDILMNGEKKALKMLNYTFLSPPNRNGGPEILKKNHKKATSKISGGCLCGCQDQALFSHTLSSTGELKRGQDPLKKIRNPTGKRTHPPCSVFRGPLSTGETAVPCVHHPTWPFTDVHICVSYRGHAAFCENMNEDSFWIVLLNVMLLKWVQLGQLKN